MAVKGGSSSAFTMVNPSCWNNGEFRYLRDLREICVNDEPYTASTMLVPTSEGHSETEVKFVGADGAALRPFLKKNGTHSTLRPDNVLSVARNPDGDEIQCTLTADGGSVDTGINLPRIWWQIQKGDEEASEWRDTPLPMTRQEFRDFANAGAKIRVRLPRRITSVGVGFQQGPKA